MIRIKPKDSLKLILMMSAEELIEKASEFYDYPLTLTNLIMWGAETFPEQEIVYAPPDAPKLRLTFARFGIGLGDSQQPLSNLVLNLVIPRD